jgi:hypothetical protein
MSEFSSVPDPSDLLKEFADTHPEGYRLKNIKNMWLPQNNETLGRIKKWTVMLYVLAPNGWTVECESINLRRVRPGFRIVSSDWLDPHLLIRMEKEGNPSEVVLFYEDDVAEYKFHHESTKDDWEMITRTVLQGES